MSEPSFLERCDAAIALFILEKGGEPKALLMSSDTYRHYHLMFPAKWKYRGLYIVLANMPYKEVDCV